VIASERDAAVVDHVVDENAFAKAEPVIPEPLVRLEEAMFVPIVVAVNVASFPARPAVSHAKTWPCERCPAKAAISTNAELRSVESFIMDRGFRSPAYCRA